MKCSQIQEMLSAYIDDVLDSVEKAEVEKHVRTCGICRQELTDLQHTVSLLRSLGEVAPPENFTRDLINRLQTEGSHGSGSVHSIKRSKLMTGVWQQIAAAVVILGIGVGAGLYSLHQGSFTGTGTAHNEGSDVSPKVALKDNSSGTFGERSMKAAPPTGNPTEGDNTAENQSSTAESGTNDPGINQQNSLLQQYDLDILRYQNKPGTVGPDRYAAPSRTPAPPAGVTGETGSPNAQPDGPAAFQAELKAAGDVNPSGNGVNTLGTTQEQEGPAGSEPSAAAKSVQVPDNTGLVPPDKNGSADAANLQEQPTAKSTQSPDQGTANQTLQGGGPQNNISAKQGFANDAGVNSTQDLAANVSQSSTDNLRPKQDNGEGNPAGSTGVKSEAASGANSGAGSESVPGYKAADKAGDQAASQGGDGSSGQGDTASDSRILAQSTPAQQAASQPEAKTAQPSGISGWRAYSTWILAAAALALLAGLTAWFKFKK